MKKYLLSFSVILLAVLFFANLAEASSNEPIAWWDFNNQSEISAGLVKDKVGSHNGQNFNGVPVSGYSGGGLYFDLSAPLGGVGSGNGNGFNVANIPGLTKLTLSFRMKTDDSANATQWVILAQPEQGGLYVMYRNGVLAFAVPYGNMQKTLGIDQNYHYYVLSYDGQNSHLYIDGQLIGFAIANNISNIPSGTWNFVSNGWINNQNTVNKVEIDDLKIYNRVLSEPEIAYENENGQLCYADIWSCGEYSICSHDGTQTRNCSKTFECPLIETPLPATTQSCTPPCNADTWSCGEWNSCSASGEQTRTCTKTLDCSTANTSSPATSQNCTPPCTADVWSCDEWTACSSSGIQTRSCNKTFECSAVNTLSPATSQSCTPSPPETQALAPVSNQQPSCSQDTWSCGEWGVCSVASLQSRTCTKTFDCPDIQTATPTTDRSCQQEDVSFITSILEKLSLKNSEVSPPPSSAPAETETKKQEDGVSTKAIGDVEKPQQVVDENKVSVPEVANEQEKLLPVEEKPKPALIKRIILWLLSWL